MASPLLPERHPQMDFFLCDILEAIPKDDLATMEHPVFSLATRPDRRILAYEHRGTQIQVVPSVKGLATSGSSIAPPTKVSVVAAMIAMGVRSS